MLVFLNSFVIDLISLPNYVNVAHFRFSVWLRALYLVCLVLCGCVSCVYPLLYSMDFII
jgi:hypothetical protein